MEEDQNIEQNQEHSKSASQKEVNENISQEQPIESTQPQTENSKLQTQNMEVHHHPNLHHRKKHWREYLLEGLMIFLAVMLGFFAENLREDISDHKKEKEFIKSLTDDLKKDTAEFPKVFFIRTGFLSVWIVA